MAHRSTDRPLLWSERNAAGDDAVPVADLDGRIRCLCVRSLEIIYAGTRNPDTFELIERTASAGEEASFVADFQAWCETCDDIATAAVLFRLLRACG